MPMIERQITIPDLILVAGTRVALGVGIGLLLSGKFNKDQRRAAGLALVAVGAATTIPLVMKIAGKTAGDNAGTLRAA